MPITFFSRTLTVTVATTSAFEEDRRSFAPVVIFITIVIATGVIVAAFLILAWYVSSQRASLSFLLVWHSRCRRLSFLPVFTTPVTKRCERTPKPPFGCVTPPAKQPGWPLNRRCSTVRAVSGCHSWGLYKGTAVLVLMCVCVLLVALPTSPSSMPRVAKPAARHLRQCVVFVR